MARIRTIKPEFPQSESMGRVSRDARLLFIQLWTICDDSGRTRAASRMLASLLFPYDDDAPSLIDGWLSELEDEGCVVLYQANGSSYLQICNWLNHQKIDKPSKSKIPEPEENSRTLANPRESSCEDQGPKDQRTEGSIEAIASVAGEPTTKAACPAEDIVALYHECLPDNPRCKTLNDARRRAIRARWREAAQLECRPFGYATRADGLKAWRQFFEICATSDFLTGKVPSRNGMPPFFATIDFLMSPSGFAKTLENHYHREVA